MAQPLEKSDDTSSYHAISGGIDAAASRLEQAFHRLEQAVTISGQTHHSLSADREKLNLLLHEAEEKIHELRHVTGKVSSRLDHTIDLLEALDA